MFFEEHSKTGVGIVVIILASLAKWQGIDFDQGTATEALLSLFEGVGYLLTLYGQWTRKDLVSGLKRVKRKK